MESVLRWENTVRWMEAVLPILQHGVALVVYYWMAVLLPMCFFRRLHPLIAKMLRTSSLFVAGVCWWQSLIVTYRLLGPLCLAVGVSFAGLGVMPMAFAVTAAKAEWAVFGSLAATAALALFPRFIAKFLTNRASRPRFAGRAKNYYTDDYN